MNFSSIKMTDQSQSRTRKGGLNNFGLWDKKITKIMFLVLHAFSELIILHYCEVTGAVGTCLVAAIAKASSVANILNWALFSQLSAFTWWMLVDDSWEQISTIGIWVRAIFIMIGNDWFPWLLFSCGWTHIVGVAP